MLFKVRGRIIVLLAQFVFILVTKKNLPILLGTIFKPIFLVNTNTHEKYREINHRIAVQVKPTT